MTVRNRLFDYVQLSESADAKLQIFGSPGRDEMRKRNFTSLEVLAEQVRKAELQIFASQDRAEVWEQNFTYLAVKAERKCRSGNFTFLAVNSERKCGRETSDLWQSRQSGNAEAEHQVFGS